MDLSTTPPVTPTRWRRSAIAKGYAVEAIFLIPALLLLIAPSLSGTFPLDDAYITLHNARTLVEYGGADPAYRGATYLTGATSLVHLALVAMMGAILPWILASKVVTGVAAFLYAIGLRRLTLQYRLGVLDAAAVCITGVVSGFLLSHIFNGLETGLAMAIILWAVLLSDSRWLPALCGVMPFVRPELALLAAPLMLDYLYRYRGDRARLLRGIVLACGVAAPWLIWSIAATGSPLPNTAMAKVLFFNEARLGLGERIAMLSYAVLGSYAVPLLPLLLWLPRARGGIALCVFAVSWIGLSLFTFPGGLSQNYFRYLALLAPLLAVAQAAMIASPTRLPAWSSPLAIAWALWSGTAGVAVLLDTRGAAARATMADDVARLVPRSAITLIHDAGYLAWVQPRQPLVDLVGLKTPGSSAWFRDQGPGPAGRALALSHIAAESRASYLVTLAPDAALWGAIPAQLRSVGWGVTLLNRPTRGGYALYRLTLPPRR